AQHRIETVQTDPTLAVHGDLIRLAQVIGNLLNNSIKYTPRGGRIGIQVFSEDGFVVVRVEDNGVGIEESMLPKVFDLFTQVDGTVDRSEGGLGVGLTLVKRFMELHNGTVTAESAGIGRGSVFTLRIPLSHESEASGTPDAPAVAEQPDARRRVLVVDDSADGAASMATVLQLRGHETRTAHSAEDALIVAEEFRPEVAFLDIGLPGMSGHELAPLLRERSAAQTIFLVALSGWGADEDKLKARAAGFDMHLTKPADAQRIVNIVRNLATGSHERPATFTNS
ncbi:MAG: ATP-binding protein, partial [Gemmatimonadota bacterium]|nr:ATP-binding protein [Gemmatimonadota bacterium]